MSENSSVMIPLGPAIGTEVDPIQHGQGGWMDSIKRANDPLFIFEQPLELVDVNWYESTKTTASLRTPSSVLQFARCGDMEVRGVSPDRYVCDILRTGGKLGIGVDSLSRSILLTSIDYRALVNALQTQTNIDTDHFDELRSDLLVSSFFDDDELSDAALDQARTLLTENIQKHEREHLRCILDPSTALWRELELHWRSILISANPNTWDDSGFLDSLARLYGIPSWYTNELLAIAREDYAAENPTVQRTVEKSVAAQRGPEQELLQFIDEYNIDPDALAATLRTPVGELYCDLWLAYVIDELRFGRSLDEINPADFYNVCDAPVDSYGKTAPDVEKRAALIDFFDKQCLGPVFEIVLFEFTNDDALLKRAWFSMNPNASDTESLLAVRRALFRRRFLSIFSNRSGLDKFLASREYTVERIIRGASLDEAPLFSTTRPSLSQLANDLPSAHEIAADALFEPQMSPDDLNAWLNNPKYGF